MRTMGRLICVMMMAAALCLSGFAQDAAPKAKGKGKGKGGARARRVVVVWSEGTAPKTVYPNDINGAIAEGLKASLQGWEIVTASLDQPDQGLPDELLNRTNVLIWWGHKKHADVKDELVAKIVKRVKEDGMGFIGLHSTHFAKVNKALMETPCSWKAYKNDSKTLTIKVADAAHPIAKGVAPEFTIDADERYSDPYAVNKPDAVVFTGVAKVKDGSEDPSQIGLTWTVGKGKVFYFQAGHETNPVFMDKNIQLIMNNAVQWAGPARTGGKKGGKKKAE